MSEAKSGRKKVTLLPGDGIGPEITESAVAILAVAGAPVEWERHAVGAEAIEKTGDPMPPDVLASIQRNAVCLKGPITTPVGKGFKSVNVRLRQALELFANVRPVKNVPGVKSRYDGVDLLIVRENTEGLYSGLEHVVVPGVVESIKVITERASTRISRYAFEYARRHGRKRVTLVHKANIMKVSDGLFLECFRRVAEEFADVKSDDVIIDAACMKLVMDPTRFDVLVLENLYGDIVSDLAAGLVGGLGVVPGANIGREGAVFESVHGSAPDIAGQGIANPTALLLSATLMLRHIDADPVADRIEKALYAALTDGSARTRDIGGKASTSEYTKAVISHLA